MAEKPIELAKAYVQVIPTTTGFKEGLLPNLEKDSEEAGDSAGQKSGNSFLDSFKKVLKWAVVVKTAKEIAGMFVDGLTQYADYEQLVGGVETLFGKSSDVIQRYAAMAYMTAGMSANEYMETVTSFSASLIQSLEGNTNAAAYYSNLAIQDMADNANKMGSDLSTLTSAYAGFAKQNYTMLDNLKLGYGGTKTEMARLISDANALKVAQGEVGDLTIESYADIVEAIHLVQTEMGITGTTAAEAASTISGSLNMVKSSWSNLLTGMFDTEQDLGHLIDQFVGTLVGTDGEGGFLGLIVPRLVEAMPRFVEGLVAVVNALIPYLPDIIKALLPAFIEGTGALIAGLVAALPELLGVVVESIPQIAESLIGSMGGVLDSMFKSFFDVVEGVFNADWATVWAETVNIVDNSLNTASDLMETFDGWLQGVFEKDWTQVFGKNLGVALNIFFDWVKDIWDGIKEIFDGVISFIKNVFAGNWAEAWNSIKDIFSGIVNMLFGIFKTPINGIIWLINKMIGAINSVIWSLNCLSFDVPDWVPIFGGRTFGFNIGYIGEISYLAKGGVLEKGQTGFLEGTGAEAVVPLENNSRWIAAVASDMNDALGFGNTLDRIEKLLEDIKEAGIVLDSGALVGGIGSQVDGVIGGYGNLNGRAVAV